MASTDLTGGVHCLQSRALIRTTKPLKKPPWNTVHRRQHLRVRADQGCDGARHAQQRGCFHGNHHQVLHTQCGRVVAAAHGRGFHTGHGLQSQPVGTDIDQRVTTCDHTHVTACAGQSAADPASDGAGTNNTCFFLDVFSDHFASSPRQICVSSSNFYSNHQSCPPDGPARQRHLCRRHGWG